MLDNPNVHMQAVLDQVFPLEEPRRIARNPELHYTRKHRRYLNMDEIELAVRSGQRLD